jgi:hypothetical protein
MTVENLKSTPITNLDATPFTQNTAGDGAPGGLQVESGFATVSAAASLTSTYQLVRVPTKARMKHLFFESEAQGAGAFDLSVYYSDSTIDGTPAALRGLIVPTTGNQFFASDINCAAAVASVDEINESGNNPLPNRNKQLWDALGLASDPGGYFDVVAVVHTTAVTTGTGRIGVQAEYIA